MPSVIPLTWLHALSGVQTSTWDTESRPEPACHVSADGQRLYPTPQQLAIGWQASANTRGAHTPSTNPQIHMFSISPAWFFLRFSALYSGVHAGTDVRFQHARRTLMEPWALAIDAPGMVWPCVQCRARGQPRWLEADCAGRGCYSRPSRPGDYSGCIRTGTRKSDHRRPVHRTDSAVQIRRSNLSSGRPAPGWIQGIDTQVGVGDIGYAVDAGGRAARVRPASGLQRASSVVRNACRDRAPETCERPNAAVSAQRSSA